MDHYYSENPQSDVRVNAINFAIDDVPFTFKTASGIFSPKDIDKGTELLIKSTIIQPGWKVLDLGCGYGCIGIVIAKLNPETSVTMTDINNRACKFARLNIVENDVSNVQVFQGDIFSAIQERFNTILLNPPQSAGKDVCFRMIEESHQYLEIQGLLQLVARHNKGGRQLEKKMQEVFGNVKQIAKQSGYRVYVSEKVN